jgi:hypothetical protein
MIDVVGVLVLVGLGGVRVSINRLLLLFDDDPAVRTALVGVGRPRKDRERTGPSVSMLEVRSDRLFLKRKDMLDDPTQKARAFSTTK